MRICLPSLATVALVGAFSQASAQASCPELTALRHEATEASRQIVGVPASERCLAYNRSSAAWGEVAKYASDHREQCEISAVSLSEFEKRHREAQKARDNVCAGRPARPFPPDIIQR
jgi:hypothetical protein